MGLARTASLLFALGLVACEAPLDLAAVEDEYRKPILRFDMFQAVAVTANRVAIASSSGAIVVSDDQSQSWSRHDLPEKPALIGLTACPNGSMHALDNLRRVWSMAAHEDQWQTSAIDTFESVLSIGCSPDNVLWVGASFGTLLSSNDQGVSWVEWSMQEDFQITAIDFVDSATGFAVGEFGTFLLTKDGGANWEYGKSAPNEFYPMAAEFSSSSLGWLGGLDGVIWHTNDGGISWQRERSQSKSPVYGILASENAAFAVGGSGTLLRRTSNGWVTVTDAPPMLAYLRGLQFLSNGDLLVAGGSGTLMKIPAGTLRQSDGGQQL